MRVRDVRFAQVLNLIRRYESVMVMVNREGMDVKLAREYLNEAKYALKLKKYEEAVEFAKRCGEELVKLKREKEAQDFFTPEHLSKASKDELRNKCQEYGLNPIGLRTSLEARLLEYYNTTIKPQMDKKDASSPIADQKQAADIKAGGEIPQVHASLDSPELKPVEELKPIEDDEPEPEPAPLPTPTPAPEPTTIEDVGEGLERGNAYILAEDRPNKCFEIFGHLMNDKEFAGLCLTRMNPSKLRSGFKVEEASLLWLTDRESEKESTVPPSLESIMYIIEEFLDREEKTIMLIDGMEYLVSNNQFNPVLRFLRRLIDKISESEAILLISISPDTLEEKELKLLERELEPVKM